MKRDAIPGHEVDRMANRLKAGEPIEVIQASAKDIAEVWFDRNTDALFALAGLERPAQQTLSLDDVLGEPEPTEAEVQAEIDREPEARGKRHRK